MAGIDIASLSQGIQNYIKEHNIDVDGDGKISQTELSELLATAGESIKTGMGDVFNTSSNKAPVNQKFIQDVLNLAETIKAVYEGQIADKDGFDRQLKLIDGIMRQKEAARENNERQLEVFIVDNKVKGKQDQVKYQERYNTMLKAIVQFLNIPVHEGEGSIDIQELLGLLQSISKSDSVQEGQTSDAINKYLAVKQKANSNSMEKLMDIAGKIADDAAAINDIVAKNSAIQENIAKEILHSIHSGVDTELTIALCHKFMVETTGCMRRIEDAMNRLESLGIEALKTVVGELGDKQMSEALKKVSALSDTIANIRDEADHDIKEFVKFETILFHQIDTLQSSANNNKIELEKQMKLLQNFIEGHTQELNNRFDNILNSFSNFDVQNDEKLSSKFNQVQESKEPAVEGIRDISVRVLKQINEISLNENDNEEYTTLLNLVRHLSTQNDEGMQNLIKDALDFIGIVVEKQKTTTGIKEAPSYNGKEIDVTPKKVQIDGQMLVVKAVPVNGNYVAEITHLDGTKTYDENLDNYPMCFKSM